MTYSENFFFAHSLITDIHITYLPDRNLWDHCKLYIENATITTGIIMYLFKYSDSYLYKYYWWNADVILSHFHRPSTISLEETVLDK